jgi:hypothetical protein
MNEAEWNETTIESDNSRAVASLRSSGCSSFPAEPEPENEISHVLLPFSNTNDDLSATGNLSLFGIQVPADCETVSSYGELQAEQESTSALMRAAHMWFCSSIPGAFDWPTLR